MVRLGDVVYGKTSGYEGMLRVTAVFDGGATVLAEEIDGFGHFEWELSGEELADLV